jgi:hypothetical protein
MKIADILRTIANNLEHSEGGAPDPRIQNPAQLIDVAVDGNEQKSGSPNGTTPSGNDKGPEDVFLPPLQQKQELLKKAVGVENVYDDGGPIEQHEAEIVQQEDNDSGAESEDIVDRIKKLGGISIAAIQELSNDDVVDD